MMMDQTKDQSGCDFSSEYTVLSTVLGSLNYTNCCLVTESLVLIFNANYLRDW